MTRLVKIAVLLALIGGAFFGLRAIIANERQFNVDIQASEWANGYTQRIFEATSVMYDCTSEIFTISHPGPTCAKACDMYDSLNAEVTHLPQYVKDANLHVAPIPSGKDDICAEPWRKKWIAEHEMRGKP